MCPTQKNTFPEISALGADGCRAGWVAVWFPPSCEGIPGFARLSGLASCFDQKAAPSRILVDMPIGLPSTGQPFRSVDREARRFLGPGLGARVFSPPARDATRAGLSYAEALANNRKAIGVGISMQAYFLIPKIREVDQLLGIPENRSRLLEAHPETVFAAFNQGVPIRESKKTKAGRDRRLQLLTRLDSRAATLFKAMLQGIPRNEAQPDDFLDAMVLALAAAFPGGLVPLAGIREEDALGRPMQMVLPRVPGAF